MKTTTSKILWQRFLSWSGWRKCGVFFARSWKAILSWQGWQACGQFFTRGWNSAITWQGRQKIFGLHPLLLLISAVLSGAALILVFQHHWEQTIPAYLLYALSAYTLTAWAAKLPAWIRSIRQWLLQHPRLVGFLKNEELQFSLGLYFEQFINFSYGIFKIASGVLYGSAWIGADGIYMIRRANREMNTITGERV